MDSVYNGLLKKDAVAGRLSNPINRQAALTQSMAQFGQKYKDGLMNAYNTRGGSSNNLGQFADTNYVNPISTGLGIFGKRT